MPKVLIRVDSSRLIGTGHLSRMLVLAATFQGAGYDVEIATRELSGYIDTAGLGLTTHILSKPSPSIRSTSAGEGYESWLGVPLELEISEMKEIVSQSQPHIIVVDHYALDQTWELSMKEFCHVLVAVDDLANRPHNSDVLIDHNHFGEKASDRYRKLVAADTLMLLGTSFSLLDPAYGLPAKKTDMIIGEHNCKVLVFFGGSYEGPLFFQTLEALSASKYSELFEVTIVSRSFTTPRNFDASALHSLTVLGPQRSLHSLLASTDFVIGSGGVNTWERLAMNKFALVISIAQNQESLTEELDELGYLNYLGKASNIHTTQFVLAIDDLYENKYDLSRKLRDKPQLVDGRGTFRVLAELEKFIKTGST